MLVLTRKSGESLRIGNRIVVTVLDNSSGQVKVGIKAPQEIPIYREEVYKRIQKENRAAAFSKDLKPHLLEKLMKEVK